MKYILSSLTSVEIHVKCQTERLGLFDFFYYKQVGEIVCTCHVHCLNARSDISDAQLSTKRLCWVGETLSSLTDLRVLQWFSTSLVDTLFRLNQIGAPAVSMQLL